MLNKIDMPGTSITLEIVDKNITITNKIEYDMQMLLLIQVGLWEETLEKCVVYVSLDEKARCWIRPLEIFMDGRFKEVEG